jgi:RNA polymerase sigma-70 factor (ECF subfamily)
VTFKLIGALEHHYERIHRMLVHLVGYSAELDDLRQAVLLAVVQNLPSFRGESALSTWISGICVNVVKTHFRRKRWRSERIVDEPAEIETASGESPVKRLEAREQLRRTEMALTRLSPEQRMVFVLATVYGHSIQEIAELTRSARSTTRMRLYYGRKTFFAAMAEFRTEGM